MNLRGSRSKLLEILRAMAPLAHRHEQCSHLLRVRVESSGRVEFAVNNTLAGACVASNDFEPLAEGEAVFDLPVFADILAASDSESVRIEASETSVSISTDRAEFEIPCHSPMGFAPPPEREGEKDFAFQTSLTALEKSYLRVEFVTANRAGLLAQAPYAKYVAIDVANSADDFVPLVAVETKRLAAANLPVRFEKKGACDPILVLPSVVEAFGRIAKIGGCEEIEVSARRGVVFFSAPGRVFFSAAAAYRLPPWRDVLTKICARRSRRATVAVDALRSALRQIGPVVDPENRRLEVTFANGAIGLETSSPMRGKIQVEARSDLDAASRFFFDYRLLQDFFEVGYALSEPEVEIAFSGPHDPIAFACGSFPEERAENWVYVLMPMIPE